MSLQQAFDNSGTNSQKPYDNELIYQNLTKEKEEEKPAVKSKKKNEPEEDDEDESSIKEEREYNRQLSSGTDGDLTDIIGLGGKILILHDELLHKVFSYLPVDSYGSLALVSPHWKHFTRTEAVYRRLCERLYLQQSKRKQLHLSRFGGKYRTMLEQRPRVRAAGGCYVLKYSYIKKIQRDMWTEVRHNWKLDYRRIFGPLVEYVVLVPHPFVADPQRRDSGNCILPLLLFPRGRASTVCSFLCTSSRDVSQAPKGLSEEERRSCGCLGDISGSERHSYHYSPTGMAHRQVQADHRQRQNEWQIWTSDLGRASIIALRLF